MSLDKLIPRINELAHKSKTTGLNDQEKKEQAKLRQEYMAIFKRNLKNQLDNVVVVDDNTKH